MTSSSRHDRWVLPGAVAAVSLPLVVAVISQRNADWHPVYDLAMTEIRVRDVGGRHTPLIGLQGRIGASGSHPGPLSFYLLAPVYRLLGASPFALQAAAAAVQAAGATLALVVARRLGGARLVVGVGIVLLLLMQGYGLGVLTEPWNPHLPVLWFVAFLVCSWSVVAGDLAMLVPAVVAASFCAQTHVPYLAVTIGIGGVVLIVAVARSAHARTSDGGRWRWPAVAALVGLLLWVPPLVDQAVHRPGNLSKIATSLATPSGAVIGARQGVELLFERLDGWQLVVGETQHPGTYGRILSGPGPTKERGAATFAVWSACAALTLVRRRPRLLVALHGTVAVATLVGAVTISRIFGVPWAYLMLWGFGIGALMLLAVVGTVVVLVVEAVGRWPAESLHRWLRMGGSVVLVALAARLVVLAPDVATGTPDETRQLGRILGPTVAGLERDAGSATGHDGRYYVYWYDATNGGSEGIGLVNELIRRGYDVGVDARAAVQIGPHRVRDPRAATARIIVASGGWIDHVGATVGAVRLAMDDPRSPAERAEFERARAEARSMLRVSGRDDLARRIDTDLFGVALNERPGRAISSRLARMLDIGVPVAVFVLPPGAAA